MKYIIEKSEGIAMVLNTESDQIFFTSYEGLALFLEYYKLELEWNNADESQREILVSEICDDIGIEKEEARDSASSTAAELMECTPFPWTKHIDTAFFQIADKITEQNITIPPWLASAWNQKYNIKIEFKMENPMMELMETIEFYNIEENK